MTVATLSTRTKIEQLRVDLCHEFPAICGERVHEMMEDSVAHLLEHARFDDFVPLLAYRDVRDRIRDESPLTVTSR
jgi:hypothetical protein